MHRPKVVVVEDNEDNRFLLETLLEDRFDITSFEEGASALAAFSAGAAETTDIILLDISLPGMDGLQIVANLKAGERTRNIPVIALTAHAMDGDERRFLDAGFDAYHAKPIVDEDALMAQMDKLIAGSPS